MPYKPLNFLNKLVGTETRILVYVPGVSFNKLCDSVFEREISTKHPKLGTNYILFEDNFPFIGGKLLSSVKINFHLLRF